MKQFCEKGHDTFIVGRKRGHCKECRKNINRESAARNYEKCQVRLKAWRATNQEKSRQSTQEWNWKREGIQITRQQYAGMFDAQNGQCRVCGVHQSELTKALAVDHSHTTGKVRGLLCPSCNNRVVKVVEDFSHLIPKAVSYLRETA